MHCAIGRIQFVIFQISTNFVYGVSTSFWFFFMVYYLDDTLRLQVGQTSAPHSMLRRMATL
jgi:hypothetical protein